MKKNIKTIHGIIIGILLWGFYIIQEEFANYGMYQLISFRVHEISSVIPSLCILATILCACPLMWCLLKKKSDYTEKFLLIVLVLCFVLQLGYMNKQADMVSTTANCVIDEIDEKEGKIIVTIDGQSEKIELKSPMIVNGMLIEKNQQYRINFVWDKKYPNKGELHMISILD